jgi:hypothetical protein
MRIIICVGTHSLMCSSSGLEAPCIIQVKNIPFYSCIAVSHLQYHKKMHILNFSDKRLHYLDTWSDLGSGTKFVTCEVFYGYKKN